MGGVTACSNVLCYPTFAPLFAANLQRLMLGGNWEMDLMQSRVEKIRPSKRLVLAFGSKRFGGFLITCLCFLQAETEGLPFFLFSLELPYRTSACRC